MVKGVSSFLDFWFPKIIFYNILLILKKETDKRYRD